MSSTQEEHTFQLTGSEAGDEQAQGVFLQDEIVRKRIREESDQQEEDDLQLSIEEEVPVDDNWMLRENSLDKNTEQQLQQNQIVPYNIVDGVDNSSNNGIQNIAEENINISSLKQGPTIQASSDCHQMKIEKPKNKEKICEDNTLIYKCNDKEMRVVFCEYESEKIESGNEICLQKLINMEFPENKIVDGWLPVKCKAEKRRLKSDTGTDEIIGPFFVEGWLDVSNEKVYFGGSLGQVLKCSCRHFVALGGKGHWNSVKQALETNFQQGKNFQIVQYEKEINVKLLLPIRRSRKKQKLQSNNISPNNNKNNIINNNNNKNNIINNNNNNNSNNKNNNNNDANGSNSTESNKSTTIQNNKNLSLQKNLSNGNLSSKYLAQKEKNRQQNWKIMVEIQNLQNLKRSEIAEKIFEKFGDTVRDLVWCDEHEIFRWIRSEGNVFYCPECQDKVIQAQETLKKLENQKIQFNNQSQEIQNQLENTDLQIQKIQEEIQAEEKKLDEVEKQMKKLKKQADNFEKNKKRLEEQKLEIKNKVQNAAKEQQQLKKEELGTSQLILEQQQQVDFFQYKSVRSFDCNQS